VKKFTFLAIIDLPLVLGACAPKPMTLGDYLKKPSAIQTQLNACDKEFEQAMMSSHSDQELEQKVSGIQAQCSVASRARDILLAGNGVVLVFDPEPLPNATEQVFRDGANAAAIQGLREEQKTDAQSKTSYARASVQYDAKQIAFDQSSMVNKSIDPALVQRERHWCHQQALFRHVSIDKVSQACGAWAQTQYIGSHQPIGW